MIYAELLWYIGLGASNGVHGGSDLKPSAEKTNTR